MEVWRVERLFPNSTLMHCTNFLYSFPSIFFPFHPRSAWRQQTLNSATPAGGPVDGEKIQIEPPNKNSYLLYSCFIDSSILSSVFQNEFNISENMGRPLGILQRIFSFSKGSKRSKDLLDGDLVNEHGHNVDADDDDLRRTATVRTTGGIGGLGMGITNTESEIVTKPLGSSSSKSGGRGMKKRRLRRASLSASNLLSWGQDRGISSQVPPSIHRDDKDVTWQENVAQDSREPHEQHGGSSSSGVAQMEEPPSLDPKIGARKKQLEAEERFTRILRSSSTKYKVISEQHLDEITPIGEVVSRVSGCNV
ncbi:hypothetical protein FRC18_008731 [Serendipita sp. 400]|nr:hypothetical protein FRC18_008731 [Serendipita sp. 400]